MIQKQTQDISYSRQMKKKDDQDDKEKSRINVNEAAPHPRLTWTKQGL